MRKREPTTDGEEIIHRLFFEGKPEMLALLEEERVNADIAQIIYDLRKEASLTQHELADLIGTKQAVIARLEDADYEGHSLSMLRRIAAALNKKVKIEFVPMEQQAKTSELHPVR